MVYRSGMSFLFIKGTLQVWWTVDLCVKLIVSFVQGVRKCTKSDFTCKEKYLWMNYSKVELEFIMSIAYGRPAWKM